MFQQTLEQTAELFGARSRMGSGGWGRCVAPVPDGRCRPSPDGQISIRGTTKRPGRMVSRFETTPTA